MVMDDIGYCGLYFGRGFIGGLPSHKGFSFGSYRSASIRMKIFWWGKDLCKSFFSLLLQSQCIWHLRSPGGGIGRRAGLKHLWPQGRAGSTPALGTGTPSKSLIFRGFSFEGWLKGWLGVLTCVSPKQPTRNISLSGTRSQATRVPPDAIL